MDGWMKRWIYGWMSEDGRWVRGWTDRWIMGGCEMGGWVRDGWVSGWGGGADRWVSWMTRCISGWMDAAAFYH